MKYADFTTSHANGTPRKPVRLGM